MEIKNEAELGYGDEAVLQFTLTGIQHAIKKAVMLRANGLSALIDEEVKRAFTPEKIKEAIAREVREEFDRSMKYGEGAKAVREIVSKQVAETIAKLSK